MATAVSIAIRRDAAQVRIQAAAIQLAEQYEVGTVDLAPKHKQPAIQEVLTLEAVADFLELLAAQPVVTVLPEPEPSKPRPPKPAPRKM
jgi:hypothetical protein